MREIKFRGKKLDGGEWVCGYLVKRPTAVQWDDGNNPYVIDIPPRDPDDNGDKYFVKTETVGQFTGLYDKNGTEIYEGDIVMFDNYDIRRNPVRIIEYHIASCSFTTRQPHTTTYGNFYSEGDLETRYEVIGNIHDNPELLKEQ